MTFNLRNRHFLKLEDFTSQETGFLLKLIACTPAERWEKGGFLPRMPNSQERLDLLLLTVAKTRRVQQDEIRFQGHRYIDTTLTAYVKEDTAHSVRPG